MASHFRTNQNKSGFAGGEVHFVGDMIRRGYMKEKFSVTGMTCSACSAGIERTLNKMDGVEEADVSLMGESMNVEYDEKVVSREQIIAAVEDLGYGRLPL